jgi:flagellar protein FliO/FliZ
MHAKASHHGAGKARAFTRRTLLTIMVFFLFPTLTVQSQPMTQAAVGFSTGYLIKLGLALLLVVGAFFAFAWFLRRFSGPQAGRGTLVRVIGSASLGHRERLVVVQVENKRLLLSVCPNNIQMLSELKVVSLDGDTETLPGLAEQLKAVSKGRP